MTPPRGTLALASLILLLLAGILVPFALWGGRFDAALSLEGARGWMEGYGSWAWAAGIALLAADIVLPIPSTIVMSALGWMYGWWLGGLIAAGGSLFSGLLAYALCRGFGRPLALWIAGADALQRGEALFTRSRGWLIALSRWLPVLPEAVACLAGLVGLPWRSFVLPLVCGSLPLGFAFAGIGAFGHASPAGALALSALLPALLWLLARRWLRAKA